MKYYKKFNSLFLLLVRKIRTFLYILKPKFFIDYAQEFLLFDFSTFYYFLFAILMIVLALTTQDPKGNVRKT